MQPCPLAGADNSLDAATVLRWYDEIAFSYHHVFHTAFVPRNERDNDGSTHARSVFYTANDETWQLACDAEGHVWQRADGGWQRQPLDLPQCLLQATLLEGVLCADEFKAANDVSAHDAAPLLACLQELKLPAWTLSPMRFFIADDALALVQYDRALAGDATHNVFAYVAVGTLHAHAMQRIFAGLPESLTARFE